MELTGRMLAGTEIGAALAALDRDEARRASASTAPPARREMGEHLRHLSGTRRMPIIVLPNAGLPSVVDGRTHYDLTPEQLAEFHARFVTDLGVRVIGGCCGTTPEHLRRRGRGPARPHAGAAARRPTSPAPPRSTARSRSSRTLSFLIIGERTNANGSKAFREAMLEGDWDTLRADGHASRCDEGAHVLDVCVDYVGRDGAADMDEIARRFATQASVPLVLDSHRATGDGGRPACTSAAGRSSTPPTSRTASCRAAASIRSSKLGQRVRRRRHLPPASTSEARPATWSGRWQVAHRIRDLAVERYGLEHGDLMFDALTFPLSTGDNDLRRDGAWRRWRRSAASRPRSPASHHARRLSNVRFGLNPAARHVLNSVFLHECVEAGLDSAIVRAGKIMPAQSRIPDEQRAGLPSDLDLRPLGRRRRREVRPAAACCSRCSPT